MVPRSVGPTSDHSPDHDERRIATVASRQQDGAALGRDRAPLDVVDHMARARVRFRHAVRVNMLDASSNGCLCDV